MSGLTFGIALCASALLLGCGPKGAAVAPATDAGTSGDDAAATGRNVAATGGNAAATGDGGRAGRAGHDDPEGSGRGGSSGRGGGGGGGDRAEPPRDGGSPPSDAGGSSAISPDAGLIPSGLPFSATFETAEAYFNNFQIEVHHGTGAVTATLPDIREWPGDHNLACDPPPTTRVLHIEDAAAVTNYWCSAVGADTGHIHTSMRTTGFALASFSPNRAFQNVHKICWDMSWANLGGRRFPQLAVVPEATYQANGKRLDYVSGANAIGTDTSIFISGETFLVELLNGSSTVFIGSSHGDANFAGFTNGENKLRRFKHCVSDNENGTVTFELERATSTEMRTQPGALPNGPVRVIFGDHNYNPPKDAPSTPDPNTIHWDNIAIE